MKPFLLIAALVLVSSSGGFAQEAPSFAPPVKEHEFLKKFVGEWETKAEAKMAPGQPAQICAGSMKFRMVGGFWAVADVKANMMAQQVTAVQTIGYDTKSKKYIGTWIDSAMNHLWKYEGRVDQTGAILTLEAEGPNMLKPGKTALYRDVYEFESKDKIVTSSQVQGEDGKWISFMTGTATRKK